MDSGPVANCRIEPEDTACMTDHHLAQRSPHQGSGLNPVGAMQAWNHRAATHACQGIACKSSFNLPTGFCIMKLCVKQGVFLVPDMLEMMREGLGGDCIGIGL